MRNLDYWRSENKEITLSIDTSIDNAYCLHNEFEVIYLTEKDLDNLRKSIDLILSVRMF